MGLMSRIIYSLKSLMGLDMKKVYSFLYLACPLKFAITSCSDDEFWHQLGLHPPLIYYNTYKFVSCCLFSFGDHRWQTQVVAPPDYNTYRRLWSSHLRYVTLCHNYDAEMKLCTFACEWKVQRNIFSPLSIRAKLPH